MKKKKIVQTSLQQLAALKVQIRKLLICTIFDLCNQFAPNSTEPSPNELELS
jgi:hypothetical protein